MRQYAEAMLQLELLLVKASIYSTENMIGYLFYFTDKFLLSNYNEYITEYTITLENSMGSVLHASAVSHPVILLPHRNTGLGYVSIKIQHLALINSLKALV